MSDTEQLRQLQATALRLAGSVTNHETREMLLSIADQYRREAEALEGPANEAEDEPPLPAT